MSPEEQEHPNIEQESPEDVLESPEEDQEEGSTSALSEQPLEEGYEWYVVHTYSGHEQKVKANLEKRVKSFGVEELIKKIFIPQQDKIKFQKGEKKKVKERIYPGYVLILMKLNEKIWGIVRHTPGVIGFVGRGEEPTPLSPGEIQNVRKATEQKGPTYKTRFSVGEAIKIAEGPFADFVGTVDKIDENQGKMTVLVSIFGRETPVEIELNQAKKM